MSTQSVSPSTGTEKLPIQRSVFDLGTFEKVTIKKFFTPDTVSGDNFVADALSLVGGDANALRQVINDGLSYASRRKANREDSGWFIVNDETGDIGEPYQGTAGDNADVMALRRTIAMTAYGYAPTLPKADREAALEKAMNLIRNTPELTKQLVAQAKKKTEAESA